MKEQTPESHEFEDDSELKDRSGRTPLPPQIKVIQNVGQNVRGEVIGVKLTQIIQPRPFRPPLQRPPRAEHFTGREKELTQLLEGLQPGRVVNLCGPGGIGKTALAVEAIWALAPDDDPPERFPDGIIFHSFYTQPQADLALEAIARAFGEEPRPTPRDAALQALAGRKALVFLDGAEDADDLDLVLSVCGKCGVLVTSRSRKDAVAERQDIPPLPLGEAEKLLISWGRERAKPDDSVSQICELVGRLPLAVRLVGRYLAEAEVDATDFLSWLKTTPLQALDLGERREDSVPLLLERSLEKLSETACKALSVVGMLALAPFGGEVVGAALELSKGEQIKAFGELVNYGILLRNDQFYEVSHRLIYTYTRSQQGVDEKVFHRIWAYYLDFTQENTKAGLAGYARLNIERPHLMEILKACARREEYEPSISLAWALDGYLDLGGFWIERVEALEIWVKASKKLADRQQEGAFLGSLGNVYFNLGQVERAIEYHQQALAISREIGDRRGEGVDLGNLGNAYYSLGQVERAIEHFELALSISREIVDRRSEGNHLGSLGNAYYSLGQVERAIEHYEQALAISREIGHRRGEGNRLGNLGNAYYSLGQVKRAIAHFEQALVIAREIGDRLGEGNRLGNLGNAYYSLGQMERAIEHFEQALVIARKIGDRHNEGVWLGNLGNAYYSLGQMERAIAHFEQALAISREIGDRRVEGNHLGNLGNAYYSLEQVERAIEHYEQALAIHRGIDDLRSEGVALGNLGSAYRALGQVERAITYHQQALAIAREIGDRRGEGNRLDNLGNAFRDLGQEERAITYHQQALAISREIGDRRLESNAMYNLACAYALQKDVNKSLDFLKKAIKIDNQYLDHARDDHDFDLIRDDLRFQSIIEAD